VSNAIQRFSNRVENYVIYRPGYPDAVIDLLTRECDLTSDSIVADVGSGTGFLSELFLKRGNRVFGVEPNAAMREAGERLLSHYPNFTSVDGSAEATTLADQSVDLITAAQSFHWFDRDKAKAEFARILKPNGWITLIWNERRIDSTPFLRAYEDLLLKYGTDYQEVRHENVYEQIATFFAPSKAELASFYNPQTFDFEGARGRLLSSSYVPAPGAPNFEDMLAELRAIFDEHQAGGAITFEYDTRVYFGRFAN
jgi:ubiquinone/menaquinone biosynthesis C-methylase UbiE